MIVQAIPDGLTSSLRVATMRLARRLRQQGLGDGLTPTQLATLATVDRLGPITLGALAAAEKVQPPSMTRVVAVLESGGLVKRTVDPTDGRVARVETTPTGHEQMMSVRSRRDAWLEDRLQQLPADDLRVLERALEVLTSLADS